MGRHALPQPSPTGPANEFLGWGAFATLLAAALAGWMGENWTSALPVAGLGSGATAVLWVGVQVTHLNSRLAEGSRSGDRETARNAKESGTSVIPEPAQRASRGPEPDRAAPGA